MKNRTVLGLVLMLFTVFTGWGANLSQPADPDKEQMIKEVKVLVDKLVQGCETANADAVLGVLANSPEFSYVVNRQFNTYSEFENGLKGWFDMITGQKLTVENERFTFPFFNSVLYSADLGIVMNYKNGRTVVTDRGRWLLLFKKRGRLETGSWFGILYLQGCSKRCSNSAASSVKNVHRHKCKRSDSHEPDLLHDLKIIL